MYEAETIDVAVIGGGHAGCEAALAAARLGMKTVMFAISLDSIAMMPCNPSIGGSSKGHLVREIDALGGEMGRNIDKTYIQTKMLNTGKGPAVYSLRAQADKTRYHEEMKHTLEKTENLKIKQAEISEILMEDGHVCGVVTTSGAVFRCRAAVLCMGTYMKSRCLSGDHIVESGPNNLMPATKLSQNLMDMGIRLFRFKTGTPARMNRNSLDFSKMEPQYGDRDIVPFSFENTPEDIAREQELCWLTYTNEKTHEVIRKNLHRSPLFGGLIEGTGPRYCPSIEDKVVRFADKERHQLFVEPEGENTEEMYIQGMSSSLPEDVQIEMYRTIPGLEHCEITRFAYAIEYDCIDATQLKLSLEFKDFHGLFSAGQFNGSSGYEEAAAQGLMGGINAARYIQGKEPVVLRRSDGYIGVLIDDLISKGSKEPYRMMTSRAEFRLLLRQDNADQRLTPLGYEIGLISQERYDSLLEKERQTAEEIQRVQNLTIAPSQEAAAVLEQYHSSLIKTGVKLADLVKRPELDYEKLAPIDKDRPVLPPAVREQVNIQIKYEGYINQQLKQVEQFQKLENRRLPEDIDYETIQGLRLEARQKLNAIRPESLGHASRITGVSPADISVLLIYMEQHKRGR
ncbi:tRNA uridine-5-carboxymethylaminomethyl(34) synthesis enzyme MnmG [Anaerotignum lactatifermentans]|uniref:tRNA uridine 5-carboxymethylaminomethyl modification enzyme MnmG n=1 Tax=Anaerotignum lactatifermentans TaxID=160404 RepID=A0ABS2GCU8_9FIRM|nr:tRNA uridine-5-carboxymethylaminomethyl(34) synthesis enzyme MnmG [Anaerotignum lactatifermentans]MBM6830071.1 tRNA uridine-5-carboxymethylaminomethyl(34) synthesis enzyme MnmG [Anaerotignum lactatifermentans]MBM6878314.1 tRNA uridine-5-carboxymethylaminomethyl(34) synthesis enzyme MnmG [Anaerotignum lactatifermentans]MBM6951469.1 tRNA uridine-5-carboxymethylaminomethyl(34) synthesis enzyme MnmG [Anaerotignum lactatifermentans]